MTATAARIGFVLRAVRIVESTDLGVRSRYGDVARDPKDEPFECFFDSAANAQVMSDERLDLLGADRRRFSPVLKGQVDLPIGSATPAVEQVDDERAVEGNAAVVSITDDFGGDKTTLGTWG